MVDIIPPLSRRLLAVQSTCHRVLGTYGYSPIWTPIVEYTPLFSRSIGDETDIVEKEMYTFNDRDERSLTMRPEGTASVARAYIEHSISRIEPVTRWYYWGPMFRHERAQRGRYRQFFQIGAEALGVQDPGIDAEIITMLVQLLRELGAVGPDVHLNTLGCPECRPAYRQALLEYLAPHEQGLCEDCRRRFKHNPLRVLDCKVRECNKIAAGCPHLPRSYLRRLPDPLGGAAGGPPAAGGRLSGGSPAGPGAGLLHPHHLRGAELLGEPRLPEHHRRRRTLRRADGGPGRPARPPPSVLPWGWSGCCWPWETRSPRCPPACRSASWPGGRRPTDRRCGRAAAAPGRRGRGSGSPRHQRQEPDEARQPAGLPAGAAVRGG